MAGQSPEESGLRPCLQMVADPLTLHFKEVLN
jgi:hypothetical protein